jgi:ribosome-binding factor A
MKKLGIYRPASPKLRPKRNDKIAAQIRYYISTALLRGDFYSEQGLSITVTYVELSADLSHAAVFVMPTSGSDEVLALSNLNSKAKYFRAILAAKLTLKFVPNIVFKIDESNKSAAKISDILSRISNCVES